MAFIGLFTSLSAVEEDVKTSAQPVFTHRNQSGTARRGSAKKRKPQAEQASPCKKKRRYQGQSMGTYNATSFLCDDFRSVDYHKQNTDREHVSAGYTTEVIPNHSNNTGQGDMYHKVLNYESKGNCNVNKKQQQKKKREGQKNEHHLKNRWKHTNGDGCHQTRPTVRKGGDGKYKDRKKDIKVNRTRFMAQEFKDQNALLVDGRLLCRHFLWGRCIKGDDCQMEHVQGYNDLFKEVCKFYIQGLCTKGERCPYMHKSFPCKFFHRKGKCYQGADCRFSHEPLNELTSRLLDETLKREKDLYELAKKAEQESTGQPVTADEPKIIEASRTPDILTQPVRPNFYNSGETNTEHEALCQTKDPSDIMDEAVLPSASDAAQALSPPSTKRNHEEPVCYSVEAVLGRQLFKPFPHSYTTPASQESTSVSVAKTSSDCSSGSANQSEAPYSVDAVLRCCKSVEKSTFGQTPTPPAAQTVLYTPTAGCEVTEPLLSSETQNETVLYPVSTRNEAKKPNEKIFKSLSSLQVHTSLISETCPGHTLASGNHQKQAGEIPVSLKPAQKASCEISFELLHSPVTVAETPASCKSMLPFMSSLHLPADLTWSVNRKSERLLLYGSSKHQSLTGTLGRPTQLKPHASALTSDSQVLVKPLCPSGLSEFKDRAAVFVEPVTSTAKTTESGDSVSHHFSENPPTEIHQHSKKSQSALGSSAQRHYSTEATAECSSKATHCGDLSVRRNKTQKRPFYSLFASPFTDGLKSTPDSVTTPGCPQDLIQSSCPGLQSTHCTDKDIHTETDKAPARSFLSLFAAPLRAASPTCGQSHSDFSRTSSSSQMSDQSLDNTAHVSDSKQRASNSETPLPLGVHIDVKPMSHRSEAPKISPSPKNESKDVLSKPVNKPTKQLVNPVCSLVSDSSSSASNSPDSSATPAQQQLSNISSHKESAVPASANSVLKSLFLCLSPYQQDGEQQGSVQISVPSECEKKDKGSIKR